MKTTMLFAPLLALLFSLAVNGCYVHRPYNPYYNDRYRDDNRYSRY